MKKYRRTKNILEVYVPEAEGWYTFATLHEDSMSDADNWLAENARLQERLQSWEEGSEPAVAELVEAEDQAQQEWYEAQASAQERKQERDEAVRQLGDAIWYEEQLRAERDRYKSRDKRRGEALKAALLVETEHDGHINPDDRCWCQEARAAIAATPDTVCGTCGNQPFEAKEWPEGVTACPDCFGKAGSIATPAEGKEGQ